MMIAELPQYGNYFSIVKLAVLLAGLGGWMALCQWVDKDAWRLRYRRYTFNGVVVGAGVFGTVAWLALPSFLLGLVIFLLVVGGAGLTYVHLRNQLVPAVSRLLTNEHFARLLNRGSAEDVAPPAAVQLTDLANKAIPSLAESDALYDGYVAGQTLLTETISRRAERVALTPSARGLTVQYSVDGQLVDGGVADRRTADMMIAYLKQSAGMDVSDRRRPQAGKLIAHQPARPMDPKVLAAGYRVPESLPARSLRLDIRTSGTRAGETVQIAVSDLSQPLTLDNLGLTERQLELLGEFRRSAGGVVLFACSDRVGASTTFYRALRAHDVFMSNIQTLEERLDGELENITQHSYSAESAEETSFARQLQSIIRRGPDIVGVSQCKDKETAQLIARAGSENIRLYVEMAAKDTFTLLARWAALVGDLKLAMDPLRLVLAQTLLRRLCPGCREAYRPDPGLLRKINLPADRIEKLYRPPTNIPTDKHGQQIVCPLCQGSGYLGRTGVFEMLVVDDELRRLVVSNASANELRKYCRTQKMLYLQEEALRKVIAGETSINEMVRAFAQSK